jgi:hypothetical protein
MASKACLVRSLSAVDRGGGGNGENEVDEARARLIVVIGPAILEIKRFEVDEKVCSASHESTSITQTRETDLCKTRPETPLLYYIFVSAKVSCHGPRRTEIALWWSAPLALQRLRRYGNG